MRDVWSLTALELRSLYGLNKFRYTKDRKEKNRCSLVFGVLIFLIIMVFTYMGGLVYGLCTLNLSEIVPAYLIVLSSLLVIAFGLFSAGHTLLTNRGYEMLSAMPITPDSIVISRFLSLYVQELIPTLVILLPGGTVYAVLQKPGLAFYLTYLPAAMLIPLIPLVISALLGTLILAVSSRMKNKSLVQTVLSVVLVLGILAASFTVSGATITPEALSQLAETLSDLFTRLYPPALWLTNTMLGRGITGLLLFATVSLGTAALFLWLLTRCFSGLIRGLYTVTARHRYEIGAMSRRSLLKALYLREVKRYFSSSIYVTNTVLGPILGCAFSGFLCFGGLEIITVSLPVDISGLLPVLVASVFCLMTTTATSISMEGKQFWVVQTLPIPAKALLDSKLLLNLTLILPCYVLSEIFLFLTLRPGFWELLWMLLLPAALILFSLVWGITVDLKLHRFDWEKEEQVVKQGASAALGGMAGSLLSILIAGLLLLVPPVLKNPIRALLAAALLLICGILYRRNSRTKLEAL